ncbi:hypothetical protein BDA96_05G063200, partial [Sorghum bicolor]
TDHVLMRVREEGHFETGTQSTKQSTKLCSGGALLQVVHMPPHYAATSFVWPSFSNSGAGAAAPALPCPLPSPAGRNDDDDRCHTWMETLVPKAIATLRSIPFRPVLRGRRGPAAPLAVAAPSLPGELPPRAPSPPLAVTWTSPPPPRPASIYTRPRLAVPFLLITLLSAAATYLAAPHTPPLHLHRRPTSALARMPAPLPIRQRHLDHPHPVF